MGSAHLYGPHLRPGSDATAEPFFESVRELREPGTLLPGRPPGDLALGDGPRPSRFPGQPGLRELTELGLVLDPPTVVDGAKSAPSRGAMAKDK